MKPINEMNLSEMADYFDFVYTVPPAVVAVVAIAKAEGK